jgi:dTDP-4-dehydrorhamnose reductase
MVALIKEMKWMILGGNGQLGRAMAIELARYQIEYVSLNRTQLDITNQSDIEKFFKKESPNVVVNAAAWTNVESAEINEEHAFLVNAFGPQLLAEECRKYEVKFVQISTDYVYSGHSTTPWRESDKVSPISVYGRTKAQGEAVVLEANPENSFIVRTAWLYSPWGKNFVKKLINVALHEKRNVEVVDDQFGQPTSALDLAHQIQKMIGFEVAPGIYHGTNSGQTSWFELAQSIFKILGEDSDRIIPIKTSASAQLAKRPLFSVLSHENWEAQGLPPMRSWQDALTIALPAVLKSEENRDIFDGV